MSEKGQSVNGGKAAVAAVDILAELRRQQEQQKRLIDEQKKIVKELRRHENVAHHLHDDHKYQVDLSVCLCLCLFWSRVVG